VCASPTTTHTHNSNPKQAVTAPAHALSTVAVDAYKKLLLVSALLPKSSFESGAATLPSDKKGDSGMPSSSSSASASGERERERESRRSKATKSNRPSPQPVGPIHGPHPTTNHTLTHTHAGKDGAAGALALPKYTPHVVARQIRYTAGAYHDILGAAQVKTDVVSCGGLGRSRVACVACGVWLVVGVHCGGW
jgi:hypothetical protein